MESKQEDEAAAYVIPLYKDPYEDRHSVHTTSPEPIIPEDLKEDDSESV